jgi:hypothetical protein
MQELSVQNNRYTTGIREAVKVAEWLLTTILEIQGETDMTAVGSALRSIALINTENLTARRSSTESPIISRYRSYSTFPDRIGRFPCGCAQKI